MVAGQRPLVLRLARRARLAQRQAASGREEIGAHWLARLGQSAAVEVAAKDHLVHLVKGKRSEASAPTPTLLATPTSTPT